MKKLLKTLMYGSLFALPCGVTAQTFNENFGSVSGTTAISTASVGFANTGFMYSGTADVRNTSPSTGYTGASGAANIFITNTVGKFFQIEGINTTALSSPGLSFGISKSVNASNGSDLAVETSTDGVNYTALSFPALPTGSGTSHWYLRTATGTIPSATNLRIRFKNNGTATQYRIDDVQLGGTAVCTASITVGGATTFCNGGSVLLTANSGTAYLWSNGATTQTISANLSATYNVTVTGTGSCTAVSDAVRVLVYPSPSVSASATQICGIGISTITARTNATDLFFSEYAEGATGNEKYIEIFNGTGAPVNLSGYIYKAFHNGASTPTFVDTLTGTLDNDSVLVLKNPLATSYTGGITTSAVAHNGNDALALYKISTASYVDIFGVIGVDPVTHWTGTGGYATDNHTLRRKASVYSGITVNPALLGQNGFSTLVSEWDLFADGTLSGLGSHTMDGTYSWSAGTTPSSGKVVTANPSVTTVYTVNGNYDVSGCSATGTVQVNVFDAVSLAIDNGDLPVITLCYGPQCANLTALPSGGTAPYTYAWSSGSITEVATVCPTVSTVYTVTATDVNGCSVTETAAIELVNACCEGTNVIVCTGTETSCVDSSAVEGLIATGSTVGPCAPGARMATKNAGISAKNNMAEVNVYPNPFNETAVFEVTLVNANNVKIEIMDLTGKKIVELNNSNLSAGSYKFNWNGKNASGTNVVSGLYFCRITTGNAVQTVKIQKLSDR